jgi:hypothetical protein
VRQTAASNVGSRNAPDSTGVTVPPGLSRKDGWNQGKRTDSVVAFTRGFAMRGATNYPGYAAEEDRPMDESKTFLSVSPLSFGITLKSSGPVCSGLCYHRHHRVSVV